MSKIKLDTYASGDQSLIKKLMPLLIEVQMTNGVIAETSAAIKEAMPQAFDDACAVVDKLNSNLAAFTQVDVGTLAQVKTLTLKLFVGQVEAARGRIDRGALLTWMAQAFNDARQVSAAVDEFLCG